MINLLPTQVKQDYGFARHSTRLLRLSISLLLSVVGVWVIVAAGLFFINHSINTYTTQNALAQQSLKDQKLEETQKRIQDLSDRLKLVVKVLSKEILFSKLIQQIGTVIPSNANLTDLKIAKTQGSIDLTAITTDYNTATQVQVNLQDKNNKIFDEADILNIVCSASSATNKKYPCTITIRARFATNNPFYFIGSTTAGSTP